MALQGGAPVTIAGQGAVPVWQPGQPAPPGYTVSADGQTLLSATTGQPVVSKPSVNGNLTNAENPSSNTLVDKAFNDNPLGGTINAANDALHGDYKKAGGDFVQGSTYGTIPLGGNTVDTIGNDLTKLPGAVASGAVDIGGKIINGIGGVLSGAPDPSVGPLDSLSSGAVQSQQELDALRRTAENNPTAAPQAGLVQLDQTNIDPLRQRQGVALDQLTAAANGTVPSAADIAGKLAANRAAAQAYGNAAALQGGNSSGGTLRAALDAQTQIQGDANTQAMINRANEEATARQQLVQGIGAAQTTEAGLACTNANLAQGTNLANQTATENTRQQDINREQNLIGGANNSTNTATAAAKAALDAKVQEQANANALKGAEVGGGANIIGSLLNSKSDRRAKMDVRRTSLVDLADDLPAYTFEYKNPADGPGRYPGVMAQDAARSPMGASLVHLGPDGDLMLDGAHAANAALAMSAQALREAEAARRRR